MLATVGLICSVDVVLFWVMPVTLARMFPNAAPLPRMTDPVPVPEFVIEPGPDGFGFVNMELFKAGFAGDTADADAAFLRDSQVPINMAIFGARLTQAAWRTKPSWAVVATLDRAIDPRLLRRQAERIGAEITEVEASHVPFLTRPRSVADVIDAAARAASQATARRSRSSTF